MHLRTCQSISHLKPSPCFQVLLKTVACFEWYSRSCRTHLAIKQVRLSFNQPLLAFSVATSHSSDSIGSPCIRKKSKHGGQTHYFHTDTSVLLLKFRYKLIAGKYTRHSWNDLWTIPINSSDKTIWEKLKKGQKVFNCIWNYCPLELFYTCTQ